MNTVIPETETPTAVETSAEEANAPQDRTPATFRYTAYIDLPEECAAEAEKRGSCKDPEHFHAWCRLPNKFEHKDIRDLALAAKARKTRQLRSEGSNAYEVLEEDMETLLREGDKNVLIEEILQVDAHRDMDVARREVLEIEAEDANSHRESEDDDSPVYKYQHIARDEARLAELQAMSEEERPADEYEELLTHVNGFYEDLEAEFNGQQQPHREALQRRELHELVDLIRQARIRTEATAEFLHVYNAEEWVVGTLHSDKSGRKFGDLQHLKSQAPEVVTAVQLTFTDLERDSQAGNS